MFYLESVAIRFGNRQCQGQGLEGFDPEIVQRDGRRNDGRIVYLRTHDGHVGSIAEVEILVETDHLEIIGCLKAQVLDNEGHRPSQLDFPR